MNLNDKQIEGLRTMQTHLKAAENLKNRLGLPATLSGAQDLGPALSRAIACVDQLLGQGS